MRHRQKRRTKKAYAFALLRGVVAVLAIWALTIGQLARAISLDYSSVWHCDVDKFNWYCDLETSQPIPEQSPRPSATAQQASPMALADIKTAEQLRRELKRLEDIAVMDPTEQNLKPYLALWQMTQQKGAAFADSWRRVVWQNPEYDYAQRHPSNNAAIKLQEDMVRDAEDQQLRMLAKDHGLIFFFRSDCQFCHAMAPILKTLSERYGMEVLGVSVDGLSIPDFPKPKNGRRIATAWGVERVPALFIGSKRQGDVAPIGFGMMAFTEIVNRIFVLTGTKPGETF